MISIIVPVFNKKSSISQCLDSILSNSRRDKEIIAVDDGSTDGSLEILREYAKKGVILIELDEHKGITYACNAALAKSRGDIIIRTDADTVVPSDWIGLFAKHFDDKEVVAAGGSYRCLNQDSAIALCTSTVDFIFAVLLRRKLLLNKLPGANRAIRKDTLLSIGGFGGEFDLSEDIGIFLKLKKIGRVIFDRGITVKTCYPDTIGRLWKRHYANGCGAVLFLKHLKTWIRPVYTLSFYFIIGGALADFFVPRGIGIAAAVLAVFYLCPLAILSILSLFLLPRKKILFILLPIIFIIQNTAYTLGFIGALLCGRLGRRGCGQPR